MPTPIALPSCLMDCCKVLFPKLDFSRIAFYIGLPPGASGANGFTMASGGPSPDIRIYLKTYEPCEKETFLVIVHELVHAVQIQGMTGGPDDDDGRLHHDHSRNPEEHGPVGQEASGIVFALPVISR